jgi:hypothetical protein
MDPNRSCLENILNLPTHRLLEIYRKEFVFRSSYLYNGGKLDQIAISDNRLEKMRQELSTRKHSPKYHNKHK